MNTQIHGQRSGSLGDTRCVRVDGLGGQFGAMPLVVQASFSSTTGGVAYTSGDTVGIPADITVVDEVTLDGSQGVFLDSITVVDRDKQAAAVTLFFFMANSASIFTTATDNDPFVLGAIGWSSLVGKVTITAADYEDLSTASVACVSLLSQALKLASGATTLTVVAVTRGAPTFVNGHGLRVYFGFRR